MWETVNNIINCNTSIYSSNKFIIDGCDNSDCCLIAAKLYEHFANIGKHLKEAFDPSNSSDKCLRYLGEPSLYDFQVLASYLSEYQKYCIFFETLNLRL